MATLKSLVDETTDIKDELKACHSNLKNTLIGKGVECSDTDKMSNLIDKTNKLEYIEGLKNYPSWYINKTISNITNSSSNSHISCENMPTARYCLTASSVMDKIYYIGGFTGSGSGYLSTNECYDPSTNTWTTKKNANTPKHLHTASIVGNKIYCISGYGSAGTLTANECYDPSTNTWTTKASLPAPARSQLAGVNANGGIYCFGGVNGSNYYTHVHYYNPTSNTWTAKKSLGVGRYGLAVSAIDNKIYYTSGYGTNNLGNNHACYLV